MLLKQPFFIGPHLLPSIVVGGVTVSIDRDGIDIDGRDKFLTYLDGSFNGQSIEHQDNGLKSGCGGCSMQSAFASLLSFMGACAESYPDGENAELFPPHVAEWLSQNSDELSMLAIELDESANLIEEE